MRKLFAVLLAFATSAFADGPPYEYGPTDPHFIESTGANQKVLVIYVQANDYRIPAAQLATMNATEDLERTQFANWFAESSWNRMSLQVTGQRAAGGNWYTLPLGLMEYVDPAGVQTMQVRSAGSETSTNPTPAMSVTASAGGSGSAFVAADAGNYRYAVTSFRNGNESSMTKLAAPVAVAAGQSVTLTINRAAAADADRFLVYRTSAGASDTNANYFRIGQVNVAGATTNFVDNGIKPASLGDWNAIVSAALEAARADVNYDQYRGVAVVMYSPFLRGAAGGPDTFHYTGGSINIQATYMSHTTEFGRFTHELGHWLGLPDLYHPVTGFPISNWDTMDCACDGQWHPWEKDFKFTYLNAMNQVARRTRPMMGAADLNENFVLHPTEVEDTLPGRVTTVKIVSSEGVHYYIEGRNRIAGQTSDQAITDERVVVTEAIDAFPMTIIPQRNVRLLTALSAGSAAFSPDPNTEITFTSTNAGTPRSYNVNVKLKALPQADPAITDWTPPPWESVDVWVDSSREGGGFMEPATAVALPNNGEAAWVNRVNRVWARIRNAGQGTATNVIVRFQVNTPGGMGDAGQFVNLPPSAPVTLAPGETKFVFTTWTPTVAAHTCIRAEIEHVAGEASIHNNLAQENVNHFYTGSSSPWHPLTIPIDVANPFDDRRRVDIRVEGLPAGWKANIDRRWVELEGKERKLLQLTITPKPDAPQCTSATLNVYGAMQIDDYIQPYGGITPIVHLANPINFIRFSATRWQERGQWMVRGCTAPAQPNSEIAIIVTDPSGHDSVVFAQTDASGCFEKIVNVPTGGTAPWTVRPYFKGNDCAAPTEGKPVLLDGSGNGGDGNGGDPNGGSGFTGDRGELELGVFTGGNWPVGRTSRALDPGFLFGIDLLRRWNAQWRIGLQAAYHQFDEAQPLGENVGITNLSAIAVVQQPWGPYRVFLAGGPGWYAWDGSAHVGAQLGAGLEVPVTTNAYLFTGATAHAVSGGTPSDPTWIDMYLGFRFRLP